VITIEILKFNCPNYWKMSVSDA